VSKLISSLFVSALLISAFGNSSFASERLDAIAHFNKYPDAEYNDCWGYTDQNGREYALLGVRTGTSIIDITDAPDIREVGFIKSADSIWKDIKTYQHYAYVVTDMDGLGLQIIDLSGLPDKVELVNTYKGFSISHNLWVDNQTGILYAQRTYGSGVRALSLKDPVHPVEVSEFGSETHDMYVRNGRAYISEGGHDTIGIYDVEDIMNPSLVKRFQIPHSGYVHNSWLSEEGGFLMTTEETPGKTVKMWDIRDLNDIHIASEYLAPNGLAHNAHIKGQYAYLSHYGSGLRILDISDPYHIQEVAYFLKGETDNPGTPSDPYVDAWGAFPFFESGKVLISDIEDGLYVVHFDGAKEE